MADSEELETTVAEEEGAAAAGGLDTEEQEPASGESELSEEGEGSEGEGQDEGEGEESAVVAEGAESISEWLKDLTPRQQDALAAKYPNAWKSLTDPEAPSDIREMAREKFMRELGLDQQEEEEEGDGLEEEEESEEDGAPAERQPVVELTPEQHREQYGKFLDQLVGAVDQPSLNQLGLDVMAAMGVDPKALDNPDLPPEQKEELRAYLAGAPKLGRVLARAGVDLFATVGPQLVQQHMEAVMPGITRMYERALFGNTWESLRGQADASGNKPYAKLPAYGTPAFTKTLKAAAKQIPGFDQMVFRDNSGRALPPELQAQRKYSILAKVASGQRVNPAVIEQATRAGERRRNDIQRKRTNAAALRSGQSTSAFAEGRRGGEGGGSLRDAILAHERQKTSLERRSSTK